MARDALLFISESGQDCRFEDYRGSPDSALSFPGAATRIKTILNESAGLMVRLREEVQSKALHTWVPARQAAL